DPVLKNKRRLKKWLSTCCSSRRPSHRTSTLLTISSSEMHHDPLGQGKCQASSSAPPLDVSPNLCSWSSFHQPSSLTFFISPAYEILMALLQLSLLQSVELARKTNNKMFISKPSKVVKRVKFCFIAQTFS
ncbi:mCG145960, partial [Mus musculus]